MAKAISVKSLPLCGKFEYEMHEFFANLVYFMLGLFSPTLNATSWDSIVHAITDYVKR